MSDYTKDKDPFYTFLKKFIADMPKFNDSYREPYIEIVEDIYPTFKDIGQPVKLNLPAKQLLTDEQRHLLGCIHYRLKYDRSPIDDSTRFVFLEAANKLMKEYSDE